MRAALHAAIALGMVALHVAGPAGAAPVPARMIRASTAEDGAQLAAGSFRPSVSAGGRFVLFESTAPVVEEDTNGFSDIFLRDLETGVIERVSVSAGGVQGNDDSYAGFMTPDARFVGFISKASNLIQGDTSSCVEPTTRKTISCPDVFILDRATGVLERVSISDDDLQGNGESHNGVVITEDGRFLAFWSDSTNLVTGDTNARGDVFVRDRLAGTTERISVGSGGVQSDGSSSEPAISDDGRFVAFRSYATNLAGLDPSNGGFSDIYVHDRATDLTERVSDSTEGEDGIVNAYRPDISGDGRYVVFDSEATNLVPGDTNGFGYDVYVHDRQTGRNEQVSVNSAGVQSNGDSYNPSITPDGRYVAFVSSATNLAPGDSGICDHDGEANIEPPSSCHDVFVHDRSTGQTDLLSSTFEDRPLDGDAWNPEIAADGRSVVFESPASTLVPDDTNGRNDAFLVDAGPATGVGELTAADAGGKVAASGWARFAGDAVFAADPVSDAGPGARATGTDLVGAGLAYRPEEGDLLARLDLDRLPPTPRPPSAAAARVATIPGVVYGMELTAGGIRYEVRVTRGAAYREESLASFSLMKCAPTCTEVETLSGSIGVTGDQVAVSIPLSLLGVMDGAELSGVRAFVGPGEAGPGALSRLDEVGLPALTLRAPTVYLGLAQPGTPEHDVVFDTPAALDRGVFSGAVDASGLAPGPHDLWARACLGTSCGGSSVRVQVG